MLPDCYNQAFALEADDRSAALVGKQALIIPSWLRGMCLNPDVHDFVTLNI